MSPQPKRLILSKKTKESVKGIHALPHSHSATMWIESNNARSRAGLRGKAELCWLSMKTEPNKASYILCAITA